MVSHQGVWVLGLDQRAALASSTTGIVMTRIHRSSQRLRSSVYWTSSRAMALKARLLKNILVYLIK